MTSLIILVIIGSILEIAHLCIQNSKSKAAFYVTEGAAQFMLILIGMECYRQSVEFSFSFTISTGIIFASIAGFLWMFGKRGKNAYRFFLIGSIVSMISNGIYISSIVREDKDLLILAVPLTIIITVAVLWITFSDLTISSGKKKGLILPSAGYILLVFCAICAFGKIRHDAVYLVFAIGTLLSAAGYLMAMFDLFGTTQSKSLYVSQKVLLYAGQLTIAASMLLIY